MLALKEVGLIKLIIATWDAKAMDRQIFYILWQHVINMQQAYIYAGGTIFQTIPKFSQLGLQATD